MSPPIYTPDGSEVSEIVLPDGSTASEVIDPDGNVVFEAGGDIPDSAVLHYQFEDDSDTTTAIDSEGSNDGSISGATYSTDAAVGQLALDFDGTDDYVSFSDNDYYENNSFTTTFWLNLNSKPSSPGRYLLVAPGFDGTVHPPHIAYDNNSFSSSEQIVIRSYDGSDSMVVSGQAFNTGQYYFVAVTLDWSTGDVQIWIDGGGTPDATGTLNNLSTNNKHYAVGAFDDAGTFIDHADALIDDLITFDSVLTGSEVQDVYDRGT